MVEPAVVRQGLRADEVRDQGIMHGGHALPNDPVITFIRGGAERSVREIYWNCQRCLTDGEELIHYSRSEFNDDCLLHVYIDRMCEKYGIPTVIIDADYDEELS